MPAPIITLLFERGNFTAESTHLVSDVFLGFAPSLIGWTLMDLMSRCLFALDRPKLPTLTSIIPVSVNVAVMMLLRSRHALEGNPAILGLGATAGLMSGFIVLFAIIHLRRRGIQLGPVTAQAR